MRQTEVLGQTGGLLAEEDPAAVVKFRLAVVLRRLGRGEPAVRGGLGVLFKEVGEVFVGADLDQMPVVQPRALDGAVGNVETERLDEVQLRTGRGAGISGSTSTIFSTEPSHLFPKVCLLYLLKFTKSTIKLTFFNIILRIA